MTPRPITTSHQQTAEDGKVFSDSNPVNLSKGFDRFAAIKAGNTFALWANRAITFFLILFALSVPHSIAASQISLGLGMIAWLMRDAASRKFHFARTPIDLPLACFIGLTILSSVFSVEPSVSLPKLKGLVLFATVYLLATNLHSTGVRLLACLLIVSSLAGVCFSLMEKLEGRGMVIASIEPDSPLAQSNLQVGDAIWMIARQRIASPESAAEVIRHHRTGERLDIEALHAGDPVPVTITVTDELKANTNPLGITVNGRTRQFRVSGFSRQFLTYAEQMQILAMLAFGGLLAGLAQRQRSTPIWLLLCLTLFALFGFALVLTASRAVIASFILALLIVAISVGRRALILALIAAAMLGALGVYEVTSSRQKIMASFNDDSTARRIGYMEAGLRVIPKHPLLGVGQDSHKLHWQEWGFHGEYVTHTHSTPIQIAMDRGLPALACYLWLIAAMLIAASRSFRQSLKQKGQPENQASLFYSSLSLGVFGAVIGFSLSSLTNYNFGDSEALTMLLFVVALFFANSSRD